MNSFFLSFFLIAAALSLESLTSAGVGTWTCGFVATPSGTATFTLQVAKIITIYAACVPQGKTSYILLSFPGYQRDPSTDWAGL